MKQKISQKELRKRIKAEQLRFTQMFITKTGGKVGKRQLITDYLYGN